MRNLIWEDKSETKLIVAKALVVFKGTVLISYSIFKYPLIDQFKLVDYNHDNSTQSKTYQFDTLEEAKEYGQKLYEELQKEIIEFFS